jgi:hypothetical protein
MIEAQGRHFFDAEKKAGVIPTVPGDDVAVTVDQDWDVKTEELDAVGNLPDLLFRMAPRIKLGFALISAKFDRDLFR